MKKLGILSFIIFFCAFFYGAPSYGFSKEIDQKLDTTVQKILDEHHIPGVVIGIWIPKKGEWVRAFGLADIETQRKMAINDYFRIGSVTKTFVTTGVLQLVDQGKLSLDDPIEKYIENVPNGDKITIRQLANMTSGLPNYSENKVWEKENLTTPQREWTPKELLKIAFDMPLLFNPGEKFYYSNTNTLLLGLVIEKLSGLSLNVYLENNILKPLSLNHTSYPMDNKMPEPFAHGYSFQTLDKKQADVSFNNPSWTSAAGQMISNLHDLKIWAEALGTGKLLSKKSFEERIKWVEIVPGDKDRSYGLGVALIRGWIAHTGELAGYNTLVAYRPEDKAIFVCLVNKDTHLKLKDGSLEPVAVIYQKVFDVISQDEGKKIE